MPTPSQQHQPQWTAGRTRSRNGLRKWDLRIQGDSGTKMEGRGDRVSFRQQQGRLLLARGGGGGAARRLTRWTTRPRPAGAKPDESNGRDDAHRLPGCPPAHTAAASGSRCMGATAGWWWFLRRPRGDRGKGVCSGGGGAGGGAGGRPASQPASLAPPLPPFPPPMCIRVIVLGPRTSISHFFTTKLHTKA